MITEQEHIRDEQFKIFKECFAELINVWRHEGGFDIDDCASYCFESNENYNNCDATSGQHIFLESEIKEYIEMMLK